MKTDFQAPCVDCGGRCCQYVAIEIDKPSSKTDYDIMRWYLAHKHVNIFIDHKKKWHVEFRTPCDFQNDDNRCTMYSIRPNICRRHGNDEGECEFYDSPYIEYFTSITELEHFLNSKNIDWEFKQRK